MRGNREIGGGRCAEEVARVRLATRKRSSSQFIESFRHGSKSIPWLQGKTLFLEGFILLFYEALTLQTIKEDT